MPQVGDRGGFRPMNASSGTLLDYATVQKDQDTGYVALQGDNGKFAHFSPADGRFLGFTEDNPSGEARLKFTSGNVFVVSPAGMGSGVLAPFEWYGR